MNAQPPYPKMFPLRQRFPDPPALDLSQTLNQELEKMAGHIRPGMSVAVGVGSRGITQLKTVVQGVLDQLKALQAKPFIIPAMGSHGGGTAEGQTELLAEYGITEAALGVPIQATMDTQTVPGSDQSHCIEWSTAAATADAALVINRIKPHTDFSGTLGSGLIKMTVVGLGKHAGAARFHRAASRAGYEHTLRERFRILSGQMPFIGGLALIEGPTHQTAHVEWVDAASMATRETELFKKSQDWMPKLPFEAIDLLIIDQIGKNISGAGMDPNVMGRSVHGYSSLPPTEANGLHVRRIFVRGLTPETHGNAIGIGLADVTTRRLVEETNPQVTFINALTALSTNGAKMPIYFDTDAECIERMLDTLALDSPKEARILQIRDTLSLERMVASESFWEEANQRPDLTPESEPSEIAFDPQRNLSPI